MMVDPGNSTLTEQPKDEGGRGLTVRLILFALLIRLSVLAVAGMQPARLLTPDSADYIRLARTLIESGTFGTVCLPEIFRVPGYPFFLSGMLRLTDSVALICLAQCFADTLTCLLVYRIARHLTADRRVALAALLFQATSVVNVVYTCKILSETLFTLFLVAFVEILLRYTCDEKIVTSVSRQKCRRCDEGWSAIAGILLAIAAYLRAVALPLTAAPILFLAPKKRFKEMAVLLAALLICVAPWYIRNHYRAEFAGFSSVAAVNLYRYNAAMVLAEENGISFSEQQTLIDQDLEALAGQTEVALAARTRGLKVILGNPIRYAYLHLRSTIRNLLPATGDLLATLGADIGRSGTLGVVQTSGAIAGVRHYFDGHWLLFVICLPPAMWTGAVYVLVLPGLHAMLKARSLRGPALLLAGLTAYFLLVPGGASHPRFRVPAMPFLTIVAGFGLSVVMARLKRYVPWLVIA